MRGSVSTRAHGGLRIHSACRSQKLEVRTGVQGSGLWPFGFRRLQLKFARLPGHLRRQLRKGVDLARLWIPASRSQWPTCVCCWLLRGGLQGGSGARAVLVGAWSFSVETRQLGQCWASGTRSVCLFSAGMPIRPTEAGRLKLGLMCFGFCCPPVLPAQGLSAGPMAISLAFCPVASATLATGAAIVLRDAISVG